ncbi:MAG TPA: DNA-binding response regulator, partial [Cryomorphaceae bacterium]|nr:DNA-binding response regulator [Cryomorphaceae bacterium]
MSKVRILIVENEAVIAMNIFDILEDLGYDVLEPATTYVEALDMLKSDQPDLAILDIRLSGTKTGIDLAHHINDEYELPFIFL